MKKNTILYIIITILLIIIAVGITYIIMNNQNNTTPKVENNNNVENSIQEDNSDKEELKDGVTLKDTYQENNTIIQEYEVILNNKVNNFTIAYTYQSDVAYHNDIHEIIGIFNNTEIVRRGYININQTEYTKENTFNESNIKEIFDENNFIIIKGNDNQNYLLVQTVAVDALDGFNTSLLYVYNDELELISRNMITEEESPDYISYDGFIIDNFTGNIPCDYVNKSPLYERTFKVVDTNIETEQYTKIENNQIYFLFPKINENYDGGILEERIYTIHNNKLEYTVNNTYKFNSVCQQI